MGVLGRLYRGETNIDFIGSRKRWYLASLVLILICVASLGFRGFNFGIEFAGGNQFLVPRVAGTTLEDARSAVEGTGVEVSTAQQAGSGGQARYVIKTGELGVDQQEEVRNALARDLNVAVTEIDISEVSSSWGNSVTRQALIGLLVFLVLVSAYLWIRFEQKMALAALFALIHDLILTAGVYSLVGFEVTPSTVIGMLTILGYSLYDTVVVFDRVQENARGLLGTTRWTYGEASNAAVNQTLMRSINTSLIGLLPVAGLLFVGAGLLGVGTLKDLALVLFVGMLAGAYSSLFIATPMLVDFKMLEPRYKAQARRVLAKRTGDDAGTRAARRQSRRSAATRAAVGQEADEVEDLPEEEAALADLDEDADEAELAGSAPRPGTRPGARSSRKRPAGRTSRSGRSGSGGGKRRR
ncbi:MAG TPA: protein translocase subunit SecF [Micromonosporaceae bacterium]